MEFIFIILSWMILLVPGFDDSVPPTYGKIFTIETSPDIVQSIKIISDETFDFAGFDIELKQNSTGVLEIMIPKNLPTPASFTNSWYYNEKPPVLADGTEIGYDIIEDPCYSHYTMPIEGKTNVEIVYPVILAGTWQLYSPIQFDENHPCYNKVFYEKPHESPLKQFRSGIPLSEIKCKENLQLIPKNNGNPACVKPTTVQKLIERGWVMLRSPPEEIPFGIEIPQPKNLTMEVISSDWCSGLSLDKVPPNDLTKRKDWFGASALIMTIGEEELNQVPHLKEMINEMKNTTGFKPHEFDENVMVKQISGSGIDHSKIFNWLKENFEKQYAPRMDGAFSSFFQYNGDTYAIHFTEC